MDDLSGLGITGAQANAPEVAEYNEPMRRSMRQTAQYAARCNLATTVPNGGLASTGYCIAKPGSQYLVLASSGGTFTVNLSSGSGKNFSIEWMRVSDGTTSTATIRGGSSARSFTSPFGRVASVLFLNAQ